MRFENKVVIVTGASSGIGRATALLLAREGAKVVLGARRLGLLEQLTDQITQSDGKAIFLPGDVTDESYAKGLVDLACGQFGGLDAAFNNAGILGDLGPMTDMSERTWNAVIRTNLSSAFFSAKHQIPALRRKGGGSILFTSTFVGQTIGLPGMAAYAASKAGLSALAQVLAVEHGREAIRVNTLLPGGTKTDMAGDDPETLGRIASFHALKRMAEPEEIAEAAAFLLSDKSGFVTGSSMVADGGNSITKL